eukprot:gene6749-9246_t
MAIWVDGRCGPSINLIPLRNCNFYVYIYSRLPYIYTYSKVHHSGHDLNGSMINSYKKGYYKRTRKGKAICLVEEKYLRSDLGYGCLRSSWKISFPDQELSGSRTVINKVELRSLVSDAPHRLLLLIDTNIALHQIDVLEHNCPATSLVVVTQTVLQELKHLNISVFRRLNSLIANDTKFFIFFANEVAQETISIREDGESMNDANDRAIVQAALYFHNALSGCGDLIFITNDVANQKRAQNSGLISMTMKTFVEKYLDLYPELMDLVASDTVVDQMVIDSTQKYTAHLPINEVLNGLKSKRYFRGTIRCVRDNPDDCYVIIHTADGEERKSIQVKGKLNVNRAFDGDVVAVEIIRADAGSDELLLSSMNDSNVTESVRVAEETAELTVEAIEAIYEAQTTVGNSGKATNLLYGKIVGIVKRNWRSYAGSLDISTVTSIDGNTSVDNINVNVGTFAVAVQFVPVEKRIPRIWITTNRIDKLQGARLLVSVDQWHVNSFLPQGHYAAILGPDGDKDVETAVLLHEFGVPHESFSADVMACLPPENWRITPEIINEPGRVDLRHIPVVSIDPPGCKDIDDALHCIRLPNGRLEAGVHIADVSYFVHPDTPIDKEAAHRSTSTYLVERRLDMLPGYLTTQLCSLRSKEDHLAFSVLWEMDDNGNIYDVRFCKSVIHSVASLTYDEAQIMLDNPIASDPVNHSVNLLGKLARILRQNRIDVGALTLASPEVRFKLDVETQSPTDVSMYMLKEANSLVEEWMLLANITVGKQTLKFYPTLSVLRRHQPPSREQFTSLLAAATAVGVSLDITSSKTLADSLDKAIKPNDVFFNKLLRILSTRCMMPAQYFCSGEIAKDQWHHYGLAAPIYTHFTSPIRRYADILVHRLLAASIGVIALPAANTDRTKQQEICSHMNRRHRAAQYAQRASVNLHTLIYFKNRPSIEVAYVLSVSVETLVVLVPKFGIEGALQWDDIIKSLQSLVYKQDTITCEFEPQQFRMTVRARRSTGNKNNNSKVIMNLQVFESVEIKIKVREGVNGADRKLVISLMHDGHELDPAADLV